MRADTGRWADGGQSGSADQPRWPFLWVLAVGLGGACCGSGRFGVAPGGNSCSVVAMGGDTDTQCVAAHLTLLCPNQHPVGVLSYWDEGVPASWREHWLRVLLRRIEPSIRYASVGRTMAWDVRYNSHVTTHSAITAHNAVSRSGNLGLSFSLLWGGCGRTGRWTTTPIS